MKPHENIPAAAPDPKDRDKLRIWQINQLSAVRRLKENPDYLLVLPPRLDDLISRFHDSMCDPAKTGEALEFARARYLAARSLHHLLDNLEVALESAIKAEPQEPDKTTPPVDKTIAISYGGWFDSLVVPPQPTNPA